MTATFSSHPPFSLAASGFEPGGGGECGHFVCLYARQAGQHILEVVPRHNAKAAAVFHDGVEDRALLPGSIVSYEEPVAGSKFCWADRIFDAVVIDFNAAVSQIDLKPGPLAQGVGDGLAQQALGQDRTAQGELVEKLLESAVDRDALGGALGFAQGRTGLGFAQFGFDMIKMTDLAQDPGDEPGHFVGGLDELAPDVGVTGHENDPGLVLGIGSIGDISVTLDDADKLIHFRIREFGRRSHEFVDASDAPAIVPMEEHASARYVRYPEVTGLGLAAAGLEIIDGGFVKLSVSGSPMFVFDLPIDGREPVGGEQRPVAEGLAVNGHAQAGEHFLLTVVGLVAGEAVVNHLGDERRGGDAAFLQGGWQLGDDRLGEGFVDAHEFAADETDAQKLGTLEVKLFANLLANAAVGAWVGANFRGIEGLLNDGKVFRDARLAGLRFDLLLVIGQIGVRGRAGSLGGWCGTGQIGAEHQLELGGIDLFAGSPEDAAAQRVDGLAVEGDFGSQPRNGLVPAGDLIVQVLSFGVFHLLDQ